MISYFRQKTKILWQKHFPEEPFDLDESKGKSPQEFPNGLVSKIGYNIEEAALRQRDFYYQVRITFSPSAGWSKNSYVGSFWPFLLNCLMLLPSNSAHITIQQIYLTLE